VRLLVIGSDRRVPLASARLRFNDAGVVFAVPGEKLARIAIAISSVFLEIDLCQDGDCKIAMIPVEAAGSSDTATPKGARTGS